MSRLDSIKSNSRAVLNGGSSSLTEVWTYKRLTSSYAASPRTYEDLWTNFNALPTRGMMQQVFDSERQIHTNAETGVIRCSDEDPTPRLKQGDLVQSPDEVTWAILGVGSSGPGSIAYILGRDEALLADADRKGGV